MDETFTLLPLQIDPTSKAITSPNDTTLTPHLSTLHTLHRALLSLPSQIPPPPFPTNPKRSAQIQKMRDQGNASFKPRATAHAPQPQAHEAIKLYTYGLEMALGRPSWEPSQLVREEASALFANRAQAYMAVKMWAEGAADAETSVELKRGPGNAKAWWRRGRCLVEMGRWEEAGEWVRQAVEVEGEEKELVELGREIEAHLRQGEK